MKTPTLYIIFHGRFPSEKAAALFALKSALSFARYSPVVLLLPRRLKRDKPAPLPAGVRAVYLPTLDFFQVPLLQRIAYTVSSIIFSLSCLAYLFLYANEEDDIDTNEPLPALAASLLTRNIIFEVHDFPERFHTFYSLLFRRVRVVLSTNQWKKDELIRRFLVKDEKIIVERNGVDLEQFAPQPTVQAREALNIPLQGSVVVYTGHLYGWKGVETLAEAALLLPHISFYIVGGAPQDVARFKERYNATNIYAVGYRPHEEIPLWQAAADVLALPNTGEEEISAHYTSPMKLFEYMASERPIVASNVPSIAEVLNDRNAYLVAPDDSRALADSITRALQDKDGSKQKAASARNTVAHHSWEERAGRIFAKRGEISAARQWFRNSVVIAAYIGMLGAVFFPFLFGHAVFLGSDITTYYYAAFEFYHQALITHQSFLLNPLLLSGFPMYLSQVAGYFDPLNYVLFHYLNGFDGLHLRLYIDYLLVLVASFFAARAWGLSRIAAFCVGPAYVLAFNETYISNPLLANSLFLMPLLVWIFGRIRLHRGFNAKLLIVGAIAVGWALLGGQAQSVVMDLSYFGLLGVLYIAFVVEKGKVLFLMRFVLFAAGMTVVGALIGAPQILPALSFTPLTRRAEGVGYALASLKSIVPGDFILFMFPDYLYFPYLSVGRKALYVGAVWSLLSLGILQSVAADVWNKTRSLREPLVFALVFIVALAIALTHSPIFYALQHVPVYKLFRFSDRWMYGGVFFFAMLGGYGLDALPLLRTRAITFWYALISVPIAFFLLIVVFLNVLTASLRETVANACMSIFKHTLYGHGPFGKDIAHYKDATLRGLDAWKQFTSLHDPAFLIPTLSLVGALFLLWMFLLHRITTVRFKLSVLGLMVVTFVLLVSFQFSDRLPRSVILSDMENSFMKYIPEADTHEYRYYPIFIAEGYQKLVPPTYQLTREQTTASVEMGFQTGWPNTNAFYGMPSIDGYDVFVPSAYIDTLALAGSTFGAQDYTRPLSLDEKMSRVYTSISVIGMMGAKYIVSGIQLQDKHLRLAGSYAASRLNVPIYVYTNDTALPVVYIASSAHNEPDMTLPQLVERDMTDFNHDTYLDCASCASEKLGKGSVQSQVLLNGSAKIIAASKGNSWLVFSESYLPGWSAILDGNPASIVRANGLYMAVSVPDGTHTIEFTYHGQLNRGI